jgi:hypothetical protein
MASVFLWAPVVPRFHGPHPVMTPNVSMERASAPVSQVSELQGWPLGDLSLSAWVQALLVSQLSAHL